MPDTSSERRANRDSPGSELPCLEAARGGYDAVFVCIGNSEFHCVGLSLIREARLNPVTLVHEIRLTELYRHGAARGAVPEGISEALTSMYGTLPARAGPR